MSTREPSALDLIQIATPCPASWDEMQGDERQRFCAHCKLNVYDVSAMKRDEAEQLISKHEGRMCVRLFRRHDGTVLTRDCPVGLKALRQRLVRNVAALAGVLLALVSGTLLAGPLGRLLPGSLGPSPHAFARWLDPEPPLEPLIGDMVMGAMMPPPVQQPALPPGPASGQ